MEKEPTVFQVDAFVAGCRALKEAVDRERKPLNDLSSRLDWLINEGSKATSAMIYAPQRNQEDAEKEKYRAELREEVKKLEERLAAGRMEDAHRTNERMRESVQGPSR